MNAFALFHFLFFLFVKFQICYDFSRTFSEYFKISFRKFDSAGNFLLLLEQVFFLFFIHLLYSQVLMLDFKTNRRVGCETISLIAYCFETRFYCFSWFIKGLKHPCEAYFHFVYAVLPLYFPRPSPCDVICIRARTNTFSLSFRVHLFLVSQTKFSRVFLSFIGSACTSHEFSILNTLHHLCFPFLNNPIVHHKLSFCPSSLSLRPIVNLYHTHTFFSSIERLNTLFIGTLVAHAVDLYNLKIFSHSKSLFFRFRASFLKLAST